MMRNTQAAIREWEIEVDQEAAQLVEQGTPPWEAVSRASIIVGDRRRRRSLAPAQTQEEPT
jgi:hypothetical protein